MSHARTTKKNKGFTSGLTSSLSTSTRAMRGAMADDYWETTFQECIRQIGHTVVVLDQLPLAVPTALTRIWCIWEMYSAIIGAVRGNKLSVALAMLLQPTQTDIPRPRGAGGSHQQHFVCEHGRRQSFGGIRSDQDQHPGGRSTPGGHGTIDATVRATSRLGAFLDAPRLWRRARRRGQASRRADRFGDWAECV